MTSHQHSEEFVAPPHAARNTDRIDSAAQTIRGVLQLAIVGLFIGMLLQDVNLSLPVLGLCVTLLLWLSIRTNATPLLVTIQLILLFRQPRRPGMEDEFSAIVYVAVVLGLLMFLSRDQRLKRLIRRALKDLLSSVIGKPNKVPEAISAEASRSPAFPSSPRATSLFRSVALLLFCVLASQLLLTTFGILGSQDGSQPVPRAERLLKPVPPLVIITVVAVIVISELAWRRLTVGQASMYLRSTQALLLHADIRMIVKRRLKSLRRQKPTPSTTVER